MLLYQRNSLKRLAQKIQQSFYFSEIGTFHTHPSEFIDPSQGDILVTLDKGYKLNCIGTDLYVGQNKEIFNRAIYCHEIKNRRFVFTILFPGFLIYVFLVESMVNLNLDFNSGVILRYKPPRLRGGS